MEKVNKSFRRLDDARSNTSLPIPAILGPLLGLVYILVMPFVVMAAIILLSGYQALHSLATLWRRSTQAIVGKPEVAEAQTASLSQYIQPLVNGLDCEFLVVNLDFRITQYITPLWRKNKVPEQIAIGQHCFEVSHGTNIPCESYDCECPVRKVLDTNDKVIVTHFHEHRLEGTGIKKIVNILALPISDSQGNITQVAELIWDAEIAKQIVPGAGQWP